MHRIYMDKGHYNFRYQLVIIIFSILLSKILIFVGEFPMSSYRKNIDKKEEGSNSENDKNKIICIKVKLISFFVLLILLILFFWYFYPHFALFSKILKYHLL